MVHIFHSKKAMADTWADPSSDANKIVKKEEQAFSGMKESAEKIESQTQAQAKSTQEAQKAQAQQTASIQEQMAEQERKRDEELAALEQDRIKKQNEEMQRYREEQRQLMEEQRALAEKQAAGKAGFSDRRHLAAIEGDIKKSNDAHLQKSNSINSSAETQKSRISDMYGGMKRALAGGAGAMGSAGSRFGAAIATAGSHGARKWKIILVTIIVFVFVFTGFGIIPPPAAWALGGLGGYVSSGEAGHDLKSTTYGEQSSISKAILNWQTAYRRSMLQATGQSIEGTVEQTPEFIGIKFDKPWVANPTRTNFGESVEISTIFEGYNPKEPFTMNVVCTYNEKKAFSGYSKDVIGGNVVQFAGGNSQTIIPKTFSGQSRYQFESVTCKPKFPTCGDYVVYITGRSDGMRVDSALNLYFIDEEVLKVELEKAAISKNRRGVTANDIPSLLAERFPIVSGHNPLSQSDKSTAAVFMLVKKMALIPYDTTNGESLKLWVAIENREQGAIDNINSLRIVFPETFTPVPGTCDNWDISDKSMTLKKSYIASSKKSIQSLKDGVQRLLPSCFFKYSGDTQRIMSGPVLASWYASLDYNYIIQRADNLEIRNADGTVCKKTTGKTTTVATSVKKSLLTGADKAKVYTEETKKLYGEKGTNLESMDFLGQQITVNRVLKDDMTKIAASIFACSEGKAYFEKKPTLVSGSQGMSIYNTAVPSMMSFGAGIKIVSKTSNTGSKTVGTVKTDIPTCVISAFKTNGWYWGGDWSPTDASLFEKGTVYAKMGYT